MARADAYSTQVESPVKKYLSWSSNDKCFTFYDREKKENVLLPLPLTFIHLDELSTIKGWHDASSSGIYSNEIRSTKNQELNVRSFKGGEVVKGLYQDIKLRIQAAGGHYCASIYALLNGEVVNISLKGSALMGWSDFSKENRKSFLGSTIEVAKTLEGKKGAVKFYTPVFTIGKPISLSDNERAEEEYDNIKAYLDSKKSSSTTTEAPEDATTRQESIQTFPELEPIEADVLPF